MVDRCAYLPRIVKKYTHRLAVPLTRADLEAKDDGGFDDVTYGNGGGWSKGIEQKI